MKKKIFFIFIIILFLLVCLNVVCAAENNCTQNWQCTIWSACVGEIQIRSCIDSNSCGNNSAKPVENQSCYQCTPNWQCTEWDPEICPENSRQTKICTDANNCETTKNKPPEVKLCTFEDDYTWLVYVIMAILIFLILIVLMMILKILKTQSNESEVFPKKTIRPYYKPLQ